MSNKQRVYFIGDSQLNRLVKTNLFNEQQYDVENWSFPGKRTDQILSSIQNKIQERTKQGVRVEDHAIVVIWVGTNDILQGKASNFSMYFKKLMNLCKRIFKRIIIASLPPILKDPRMTPAIIKINKYIASYNNAKNKVRTINLFSMCCTDDDGIRSEFYEQTMGNNKFLRDDRIHLNVKAFKMIASKIKEVFSLL